MAILRRDEGGVPEGLPEEGAALPASAAPTEAPGTVAARRPPPVVARNSLRSMEDFGRELFIQFSPAVQIKIPKVADSAAYYAGFAREVATKSFFSGVKAACPDTPRSWQRCSFVQNP